MWDDLPRTTFPPFDPKLLEFCESISKDLFAQENIKQFPDIAALAFWLRKAHLVEMKGAFDRLEPFRMPRGLVFHIAPANVEVMFVYSWILALLTGNANVVRLPSRRSPGTQLLFQVIQNALEKFSEIQKNTRLISYGHETEITSAISLQADVRIIWGGDQTIQNIRNIPSKINCLEIVFADRFAFSAIDSHAYLSIKNLEQLHRDFYNDMYGYDQCACSSPRALFWIGSEENFDKGCERLFSGIQKVIDEKQYQLPLSLILKKETYLYGQALSFKMESVKKYSNELTVIYLKNFHESVRTNPGLGLLYVINIPTLDTLWKYVDPKDQTLTTFGFSKEEIHKFAEGLKKRGIDRIVPIGKALAFDYIWDGYNLLEELTRVIHAE